MTKRFFRNLESKIKGWKFEHETKNWITIKDGEYAKQKVNPVVLYEGMITLGSVARRRDITTLTDEIEAINTSELIQKKLLEVKVGELRGNTNVLNTLVKIEEGKYVAYDKWNTLNIRGFYFSGHELYPKQKEVFIPEKGYAVPFTNEREFLKNIYDTEENKGFPRKTIKNYETAKKMVEKEGIDPVWTSFFQPYYLHMWRDALKKEPKRTMSLLVQRIAGYRDSGPIGLEFEFLSSGNNYTGVRERRRIY